MRRKAFFLAWGFLVWLVATALLRLAGQHLPVPGSVPHLVGIYLAALPLIALVPCPVYRWQGLASSERPLAAALLCLPGMLLDTDVVLLFAHVFRNLPPAADGLFASWLLWAYALALLTGLFQGARRHAVPVAIRTAG